MPTDRHVPSDTWTLGGHRDPTVKFRARSTLQPRQGVTFFRSPKEPGATCGPSTRSNPRSWHYGRRPMSQGVQEADQRHDDHLEDGMGGGEEAAEAESSGA